MAAVNPDTVPFWPWGLLLIAVGLYIVGIAALIAAGRREDARALAGFIPDCVVLISRLARDRRISRPRRAPRGGPRRRPGADSLGLARAGGIPHPGAARGRPGDQRSGDPADYA